MALKVVGTGTTVAITAGAGSTSTPIALQSGYIRVATTVAAHVGIATTSSVLALEMTFLFQQQILLY